MNRENKETPGVSTPGETKCNSLKQAEFVEKFRASITYAQRQAQEAQRQAQKVLKLLDAAKLELEDIKALR